MTDSSLPPLSWLRAFEASARHQSFTGAARELNVSQPAVSQHVKALESHLNLTLFVRQGRRLEITVAGKSYLPTVQEGLEVLQRGTRALIGGDRGKVLTLQCNLAFSVYWLAPRLPGLMSRFPWMTININSALWDPELTAKAAHVEIRFGLDLEQTISCTRLGHDTCFPVCAPTLAAQDWRDYPLFDCLGMKGNWQSWARGTGHTMPKRKRVNTASTYAVSLGAAQNGGAFALGHETLCDTLIAQGSLMRASDAAIPMPEAYYLMPVAASAQTPSTRAFVTWLSEQIRR